LNTLGWTSFFIVTSSFKRERRPKPIDNDWQAKIERELRGEELGKTLGLIQGNIERYGKEMVHEINVFNRDGFGHGNSGRCEIDDPLDPCLDEIICRALGPFRRCGDNADFNLQITDFFLQPTRAHNLKTGNFLTDFERVAIKRADKNKTTSPKNPMAEQGSPKISDTNQGDIPGPINTQGLLDGREEILNIIANSPHSKLSEIRQILPDLGRVNSARAGESVRGDDGFPILDE
jgi:hypothetical protein